MQTLKCFWPVALSLVLLVHAANPIIATALEREDRPIFAGSLRQLPGSFNARDIKAIADGPDGAITVLVSPGGRIVRFDPDRQRAKLIGSLAPWSADPNTESAFAMDETRVASLVATSDRLWFGTSGTIQPGAKPQGYLFSCRITDAAIDDYTPLVAVGDEAVSGMVYDPAIHAIYAMTMPGGRLIRYIPGQKEIGVIAKIPDYDGARLARLADGRLLTIGGQSRLFCVTLATNGQPGVDALHHFADTISQMCAGADGNLYLTASNSGHNFALKFDPLARRTEMLGTIACGAKIPLFRQIRAMSSGDDGRLWFALSERQVGGGLFTAPPLSEKRPWTNSDRSYTCRKTRLDAVNIDGTPDEHAWRMAMPATGFVIAGPAPQQAKHKTVSRLLWTDTHLLVAHECATDAIRTSITGRDMTIWDGEAAEMILCPMGSEAAYYEININPSNALYDARLEDYIYTLQAEFGGQWATNWNAAIKFAAKVHSNAMGEVIGWSAEMAIPFADMDACPNNPPGHGTTWTFNFFRAAKQDDGKIEWSAWTSTHAEFHRPYDYPVLNFAN